MVDAIGHASRIINFIRRNEPDRQTMKTWADWQPVGDVVNWNDQYRTLRQLIDAFNGQPELQGRLHATRKLHALTAAELRLIQQFLLVFEPFEGKFHRIWRQNFQSDFSAFSLFDRNVL